MDIKQSTQAYEAWLAKRMPLLDADLRLKHEKMAESPFPFLRATFYRWAQLWPGVCPELAGAPAVLGVGDLHVENFGTWRDAEGRLIWGVNDFDEVTSLPYANDLVRLAVSAALAIREDHLSCELGEVCDAVLDGYRESLAQRGAAFVLAEEHHWLRLAATGELRDPVLFWQKLTQLSPTSRPMPPVVKQALKQAAPDPRLTWRTVHRQAGLGSLGRPRFTFITEWRGASVAREAKQLAVSAWNWEKRSAGNKVLYQQALEKSVRVKDPFVFVRNGWLMRRLAPDCSRIELASLPKAKDELKLLHAMGWETANVHLGSPAAIQRVLADLKKRPNNWLQTAAGAMTQATLKDWQAWAGK